MIVFGWRGFPQYAARCVGAFVKVSKEPVVVVGPKPMVPVEGMERVCGCPVYWVDRQHDFVSQVSAFQPSEVSALFVSGWGIPALDDLAARVKKAGGRVVMMSDHRYERSFRAFLANLRFRLLFRRKFDRFFVPGKSGRKLARSLGVPDRFIEENLYSADASLFKDGKPLPEREKKIICVAQFIPWKNAKRLMQAFNKAVEVSKAEGWTLEFYGSGPLKGELEALAATLNAQLSMLNSHIRVHSFVQPEQLAGLYQSARLFSLPSEGENWGLVVHEGALSGCALLLSKNVGSAADLLNEGRNGWSFNPFDLNDMANVLVRAMTATDSELIEMQTESLRMAKNVSLEKFAESVKKLIG